MELWLTEGGLQLVPPPEGGAAQTFKRRLTATDVSELDINDIFFHVVVFAPAKRS